MNPGLLLLGSGGFGREAARSAMDGGYDGPVLGFLDDDPARQGTTVGGLPVLGPMRAVHDHPEAHVVVATGRPDNYTSRASIVAELDLPAHRYATIVHPRACLAGDTRIGPGTVVLAGSVSTAGVTIGSHAAVMPAVVLTHDTVIGDFATLASGAALAGGVHVSTGAYIGAGALVRQNLTIGGWAMVGMGSLVLQDVPEGRMFYGRPAVDRGASSAAGFSAVRQEVGWGT